MGRRVAQPKPKIGLEKCRPTKLLHLAHLSPGSEPVLRITYTELRFPLLCLSRLSRRHTVVKQGRARLRLRWRRRDAEEKEARDLQLRRVSLQNTDILAAALQVTKLFVLYWGCL